MERGRRTDHVTLDRRGFTVRESGLGELGQGLSEHLSSRRQVEQVIASTGVPVTAFRTAKIIGSGSASFEILRYLVERLPVMVTPSWVKTESQPVAIADVLHWLVRCLSGPDTAGKALEIGGADVLPYRELMCIMAEELGLRRRVIIPLPVLTPRLSSGWISLVTPVSYRIARPLADGLRNRVVVTSDLVQRLAALRVGQRDNGLGVAGAQSVLRGRLFSRHRGAPERSAV